MQKDGDVKEASADNAESIQETLPVLKQLRLGISRNYYAMANVFGLKRLQDYFQVDSLCRSVYLNHHLVSHPEYRKEIGLQGMKHTQNILDNYCYKLSGIS